MAEKKSYRALILLDGSDPLAVMGRDEIARYKYVVAADGALNRLLIAGIKPSVVVGDLDSVNHDLLQVFQEDGGLVEVRHEQDTTDFEKSLNHLVEKGFMVVDVVGYNGDRFDHMLSMLDVAIRFSNSLTLRFFDTIAVSWLINSNGQSTFNNKKDHMCSLIPVIPCDGVITTGFRWEISNKHLEFGTGVSCSNVIISDLAVVKVEQGSLLVYLHNDKIEE